MGQLISLVALEDADSSGFSGRDVDIDEEQRDVVTEDFNAILECGWVLQHAALAVFLNGV